MASYVISISTSGFSGEFAPIRTVSVTNTGEGDVNSSSSPLLVVRGDTIRFRWVTHIDEGIAAPSSITITGLDSSVFENNSSITINSPNSNIYFDKVISASATIDLTDTMSVNATSWSISELIYAKVISSVDTSPDAFSIGSDLANLSPSESNVSTTEHVVVSGINSSTPISISNGEFRVTTSGTWRSTSTTVLDGQRVDVRTNAPAAFNQSKVLTLTIGDKSDSITVSTRDDGADVIINFPKTSGSLDLFEVGDFYGRPFGQAYTDLEDYLKGGAYVPSIAKNASVPTALPIDLDDFLGSGTVLFFTDYPSGKSASWSTPGTGTTLSVGWLRGTDFDVGFGDGMKNVVEYSYELIADTAGPTITTPSNPATFANANTQVIVSLVVPSNYVEQLYTGVVRIKVKHPLSSEIYTNDVPYSFFISGD